MILALLLAHLVGDYILQWDNLSRWKSEKLSGVLVHGLIVTAVTLLFTLPLDPSFWPWAFFIGATHTLIDGLELPIRRRLTGNGSGKSALILFTLAQVVHLTIIVLVLIWSAYLEAPALANSLIQASSEYPLLTFVVAYAFLTMPAWILIKFLVYGLMNGSAPEFPRGLSSKYGSMVERSIIATLILFGQFFLVPLVAMPRLILEWPRATGVNGTTGAGAGNLKVARKRSTLYVAELIASIAVAVAIGLALRQLR